MSKYIKLEDVINVFGRNSEYHADTIADMLLDLPTIEVSEDCISREWVIEKMLAEGNQYDNNDIKHGYHNCELIVYDAPSVVPTTEQSSEVGEWELASDDDGEYGICSICGNDADFTHYGEPYR